MPQPLAIATPAKPPPAPQGVKWIDVAAAAGRMRVSDRRVRQLCGERWFALGLAKVELDGGCRVWLIREDADAALSRVRFSGDMDYDAKELNGKQRDELNRRVLILKGWWEHCAARLREGKPKKPATVEYLRLVEERHGLRVSITTLYEWEARWKMGGDAALVDGRWQPARAGGGGGAVDPFLEELKRLYLDFRKPRLTTCVQVAAKLAMERGWPIKSYPACHRFIQSIPQPVVDMHRNGKEAYTNDSEPFHERDYSPVQSNEIWCGDHHQFDVWVKVGVKVVRPWLTVWMDMRSRKIVGWVVIAHDPNQEAIIEAFRRGVQECGIPQKLYIDNGKDYDGYALNGQTKKQRRLRRLRRRVGVFDHKQAEGIFGRLGAGTIHCQPYHGQSKPIERFFGTLESQLCPAFPTYCGNKPDNRPENLDDQLAGGKAPTLAEFIESFSAWLNQCYHTAPHRGDGMDGLCPDQAFAKHLIRKVTAPKELLDTLLLKRTKPVKVTQNGVRYKGLVYGQYEPKLIPWMGKQVVLAIDDRNLGSVQVWTPDDRFICIAPGNRKIPANASDQELREAMANKRRHRKVQREFHETRPFMHEDLPDLIIRARAETNRQNARPDPDLPPASIVPLQTPLTDQLPALQRALEAEKPLRKAVGAESMSERQAFGRAVRNAADADEEQESAPARFIYESKPGEPSEPREPDLVSPLRAWMESQRNEPAMSPEPDPFQALMDLSRRNLLRNGGDDER